MKVLLVDDHPLFLDGLRSLLVSRGIEVVGTARDGLEAIDRARDLRPDVILMDIHMPNAGGLTALRQIKTEQPEARIVMLTMSAQDDELFEAIKAGASGYLLKTQDTADVFALLDDVGRGEVALSPGLAARILREFSRRSTSPPPIDDRDPRDRLSPREMQVLAFVAQGLTYKEVGARLFLSERTIKYHMGRILERLHVETRAQALAYARRTGLVC